MIDWKVEAVYLLRILVAAALGFIIGVERKMRYKEAGMKTHALVACGAALMTLIGKYGFAATGDGSRVAAQVVTGIGFLGAGIIMYRRDSLRGVTTAAGIWATAGVGMASGAGMYILAVGAAFLIVFLQFLLHLPISFFKTKLFFIYRIKFVCADNENEMIKEIFGVKSYSRVNYYSTDNGVSASAEISTNKIISDDDIKKIVFENSFITSIERVYHLDG